MSKTTEKTQMIRDAITNLLPHLQGLQETYKEFFAEEKSRIENSISNLEELLKIEYSDDTGESELALSILQTIYGRDSEIVEEETS